jgi:hypothetical protein
VRTRRAAGALAAAAVLLAACSGPGADTPAPVADRPAPSRSAPSSPAPAVTPADAAAPLRQGEQFRTLTVPGGPYLPAAPSGGHDDYHCFLLDPHLATDRYVTGSDVLPGNVAVVHHAILFTVPPDQVADAEAHDAQTAGRGWTCFGGTALPDRTTTALSALDAAPWLAAWAPGGGESVFGPGTGKLLAKGSRVILQVHYNLREGSSPDSTAVRLRLARAGARLQALKTMLLVAPVELPCPPGETDPLCDRSRAVTDLTARFGPDSGRTVAGLQLLCGGSFINPQAGSTQHCDRRVGQDMAVRAVAGHMHLLGRSISVTLEPGGPRERTLLDRPVWDFDNQGATPLQRAARVRAGDTLRVTCTHDATLRSQLPELQDERPRYVTWGEGTSDEMCLGIVMYTER